MRSTLVILNYQREFPPFMQNLIHYADQVYERIFYFTPELYNDNRSGCDSSKLTVVECKRREWNKSLIQAPGRLLKKRVFKQCNVAKKTQENLWAVVRQLFVHDVCSETLVRVVEQYIKDGIIIPQETVVLATWFATEAYASAKLKKQHPSFLTVSYAHSFEISINKNPFMAFDMNEFKHFNNDAIVFISKKMRDSYFNTIQSVYGTILGTNTTVRYLGSKKQFPESICTRSKDGTINLLSCSGATQIKRINLIIQAFSEWSLETKINWTHIGGGPLLDSLKEQASSSLDSKENVSYQFLGSLTNKEVQKYYCEHNVDLFLNVSEDEGLPVSIMESMSYGVPAIATDVGGTSEIVTPQTGFLIDKWFSNEDLLNMIITYLNLSEEEKDNLRVAALNLWKEQFDCEKNSISFLSWLSEVDKP